MASEEEDDANAIAAAAAVTVATTTQKQIQMSRMNSQHQQQQQQQEEAAAAAAALLKALDQSMQPVLMHTATTTTTTNDAAAPFKVDISAAYRHVRQYAPHLVLTESAGFAAKLLAHENNTFLQDGLSLLRYWHVRAQLFAGRRQQQQQLLLTRPLLECLTPDDVACLRRGHVVVFEQAAAAAAAVADENNNSRPPPILYLDVSRLRMTTTTTTTTTMAFSRQTRLRSVWVVLQQHFLQQQQQQQRRSSSFVLLVCLDQHAFLDNVVQEWIDWLYEFFPLQAEKVVFIGMDDRKDATATATAATTTPTPLWWNAQILPRALKVCGKLLERSDDPEVKMHFLGAANGNGAAGARMAARHVLEQEYGFNCIPERFGGTWTYEQEWNTWVDGLAVVAVEKSDNNNVSLLEGRRRSKEHVETDYDTTNGVVQAMVAAAVEEKEDGTRNGPQQEMTMLNKNHDDGGANQHHPHYQDPRRQGFNVEQQSTAAYHYYYHYYWELRKDLFGEKRHKLPLTQTGEGALSRQDLACLKTGAWMMLPKDREGRIVLFCDPSRGAHDHCCLLRCAFYFISLVHESCSSSTSRRGRGLVVLFALTDSIIGNKDRRQGICLGDILNAHSLQLQALHCVQLHVPGGGKDRGNSLWLQTRVDATRRFFGLLEQQQQHRLVVVHAAPTQVDLIRRLEGHGLSKDGLPSSLGGCFGYEQFAQWQELRIRVEWGLPLGSTMTKSSKKVMDMFGGDDSFCAKPLSELTANEKEERQRRMNIVHARRKRERERVEVECTKEKCAKLRDCNMHLAQENAQLEVMLNQVKEQIPDWEELCASALARKESEKEKEHVNPPSLSPVEEQKQHKREMNRLYSQRKRDRERLQIETLTKQCDELRARNMVISRENQWMEEMIENVMQQVSRFEKRSVTERGNARVMRFYPGSPV